MIKKQEHLIKKYVNESIKEISYKISIRLERKTWKQEETWAGDEMGKQFKYKL